MSPDDVIAMSANRLSRLYKVYWFKSVGFGLSPPISFEMSAVLKGNTSDVRLLAALGRHLVSLQDVPRVEEFDDDILGSWFMRDHLAKSDKAGEIPDKLIIDDQMAYVGLLYCVALATECVQSPYRQLAKVDQNILAEAINARLKPISEFIPYAASRVGLPSGQALPPLAVNDRLAHFFRRWAAGEVSIALSWIPPGGIEDL